MRVAVTGATGTIGSALVSELHERGDEVTALSRDAERATQMLGVPAEQWAAPTREPPPADALRGRDAVVHLLGEPIAQRWTEDSKREILESRTLGTSNLVAALRSLPESVRPRVLVSQAGTGFYGARGDERLDESAPAGDDFAARVVVAWEAAAGPAAELGMRVVTTRTGPVLSEGGALGKMLPFFKLGLGGPVNVTAPRPATNKELSKALGRAIHRPAVAPVPGFAVKVLYGEMAVIVTTGQRAIPARLTELGYAFRRPELEDALREATERG